MTGLATVLITIAAVVFAPPSQAQTSRTGPRPVPPLSDPQAALWEEIERLYNEARGSLRDAGGFEAAVRRRRGLLERLRQYGVLYPGGERRDEVLRLELRTLFEIGCLSGGSFDALREHVDRYTRHPPTAHASEEVAYWAAILDDLKRTSGPEEAAAATRPAATATATATRRTLRDRSGDRSPDNQMTLATLTANLTPGSRRWLRFARRLFDRAEAARDLKVMEHVAGLLQAHAPDDTLTRFAAGRVARADAIGRPFWLSYTDQAGVLLDSRRAVGAPVLIVVWDGTDPDTRETLREIEMYRRRNPELRVFGVNLDVRRADMARICDDLEIRWPQYNDGRGGFNEFAVTWGVRRVPTVFVVDRRGRLVGVCEDDGWHELADTAAAN